MPRSVHDVQGYAVVLEKIIFVTRIFEAENSEGFQFNIRMDGGVRVSPKFPTRAEATIARELLIKALKQA